MCTRFPRVTLLAALAVVFTAACGRSPLAPTPLLDTSAALSVSRASTSGPLAAAPDAPVFATHTIQFTDVGPDGVAVTTYTEAGFTISAAAASWVAYNYGNPGPSVIFYTPQGVSTTGEVSIRTADGLPLFRFTSVDLYSSLTTIPYTITGTLQGHTMFTEAGTLGHTFGNFAQVASTHSHIPIDTLVIRLTNDTAPNPMGLDNIVLRR